MSSASARLATHWRANSSSDGPCLSSQECHALASVAMLARYVVAIIVFYLDDDGSGAICLKFHIK
jgi:hypothetical protein